MQTVKTVKVHFVTIADLYDFVAASTRYPFDVVLKSGHYNATTSSARCTPTAEKSSSKRSTDS